MKYGKRQLILASLVLALGAAVYLNWQFAGTKVQSAGDVSEESASSALGAAQLVNNAYVETVSDTPMNEDGVLPETEPADGAAESSAAEETAAAVSASAKLSDARLTRQTARDEAVELLEDILKDDSAEVAVKQAAVDEAAVIAQNILKETNIESLIEAKGFTECVAYINGESCTVVVNGDMEDEQNALIVRDIAVSKAARQRGKREDHFCGEIKDDFLHFTVYHGILFQNISGVYVWSLKTASNGTGETREVPDFCSNCLPILRRATIYIRRITQ